MLDGTRIVQRVTYPPLRCVRGGAGLLAGDLVPFSGGPFVMGTDGRYENGEGCRAARTCVTRRTATATAVDARSSNTPDISTGNLGFRVVRSGQATAGGR